MKNLTYITFALLIALSLSACKSSVDDETKKPNLQSPLSIGVKSQGASGAQDPLDKFEAGDQIALFMIQKQSNEAFTNFAAFNFKYVYASPTWNPASLDKQLMWPAEQTPIYIYGIHPAPEPTGAVTAINALNGDVRAQFNLAKDQTNINIKKFDLMRSENKGENGNGMVSEVVGTTPITMSFKHKLCKIQFGFVVTKDFITSIPTNKVTITQIKLEGTQISLRTNMGLKTGDINSEFGNLNSLEWNGNKEITLSTNYAGEKTIVADMLVIPFEPVAGLNSISFTFKYNDGNDDVEKVLTTPIKKAIAITDILFAENQYNIVKVTANMTDSKLGIIADIVDWNKEDHEIEPL